MLMSMSFTISSLLRKILCRNKMKMNPKMLQTCIKISVEVQEVVVVNFEDEAVYKHKYVSCALNLYIQTKRSTEIK